ncbi:MAG: hypothetical protein QOH96_3612, partial [Blastocatellia bacterium]|nr:hypothetical protein [Blastocatellia bacterium]
KLIVIPVVVQFEIHRTSILLLYCVKLFLWSLSALTVKHKPPFPVASIQLTWAGSLVSIA